MPVFALGRAQELLLILDELWAARPELQVRGPVFVMVFVNFVRDISRPEVAASFYGWWCIMLASEVSVTFTQ